jgi:hypothetical protein
MSRFPRDSVLDAWLLEPQGPTERWNQLIVWVC